MDGFDSELARLRAQIARSEQLRARLRDLYPRREQLAAQEEGLREKRVDEQEDVDRLEAKSLARYFFTLTGSLDERLDRERAEAREAAVRHDALLEELRDVEEDIAESESELAGLRGCEQQYDELIDRKAEALKRSGSPIAGRLRDLEAQSAMLERRRRETEEAIRAGQEAYGAAEDVVRALSGASTWGVVDMFSDSFLADMAKYSRIDEAQRAMERLRVALRRFDTELADVGGGIDVRVESFLGFADVFFDNIFTDLAVSSRIQNSLASAQETERRIELSLNRLGTLRADCLSERERFEAEYESLVERA